VTLLAIVHAAHLATVHADQVSKVSAEPMHDESNSTAGPAADAGACLARGPKEQSTLGLRARWGDLGRHSAHSTHSMRSVQLSTAKSLASLASCRSLTPRELAKELSNAVHVPDVPESVISRALQQAVVCDDGDGDSDPTESDRLTSESVGWDAVMKVAGRTFFPETLLQAQHRMRVQTLMAEFDATMRRQSARHKRQSSSKRDDFNDGIPRMFPTACTHDK
jgi:hypothetical protein